MGNKYTISDAATSVDQINSECSGNSSGNEFRQINSCRKFYWQKANNNISLAEVYLLFLGSRRYKFEQQTKLFSKWYV